MCDTQLKATKQYLYVILFIKMPALHGFGVLSSIIFVDIKPKCVICMQIKAFELCFDDEI